MTVLPAKLDAQTAWLAWEPTEGQPWNHRLAAHLFRRACFGASSAQLDEAVGSSPQACVDRLLDACENSDSKVQKFNREMDTMADGLKAGDPSGLEPWWLYRMLFTPAPLQERMTLFWHGLFATSAAKVTRASLMLTQNRLLRRHSLSHFEKLVLAVSRDPAMLTYLDSTSNARLHPNENYARELMELFCLGIGNYTERDVQETARCFTGWEIRHQKFRFNRHQHDFGTKQIFGQAGDYDGDEAVRIILRQDAAPRFLIRKLVNYFVCDPPVSDELVEPLARELRENSMHVQPIVRRILLSRYFYSTSSIGMKIRSPIELSVGLLRCLDGTVGTNALAEALRPLGQRIFYPPNVKGWVGGRNWINATTLIGRVNLVTKLLQHDTVRFANKSLAEYFNDQIHEFDDKQPGRLVDALANLLLAVPLPHKARHELIRVAQLRQGKLGDRTNDVLRTLAALPEFQLG